jgi:PAS domain S-box-containing protein
MSIDTKRPQASRPRGPEPSPAKENPLSGIDVAQLRALFDMMPQLAWTARPDGTADFFNAGWYAYTGSTAAPLDSETRRSIYDPDARGAVLERWQSSIRTGTPFEMEFRLRGRDGTFRWFLTRVSPVRDAEGSIVRWIGISTDIDDQVAGRRRDREDLARFFDTSLDLLCIAGLDGYFKRLNPAWLTLGWTEEELLAKPFVELVHEDDREATRGAVATLMGGAPVQLFTNRYRCRDGTYRWIEWRSTASTERALIYASARDVTERRLEEDEREDNQKRLVAADRLASVGTLAAGVAHEINNPLFSLTSNLEMIAAETRKGANGEPPIDVGAVREMVVDAREASNRVRLIVADLLTFSQATEERRVVLDLRATMKRAIRAAAPEIGRGARLFEEYGDAPYVEADEARLAQVFLNLLVNAAQASLPGGATTNDIRVATSTDTAGRAVIEVHDTGSGITEEVMDHIFEPFFTTKPLGAGKGLGLSISHNIVVSLGGELTATSEAGRSTIFRVVLPAAPEQVLAASTRSERPAWALASGTLGTG